MVTLQAALAAMLLSGAGQTVLLDFYSDGCLPCRAMNPILQDLEKAGYPVQRINVASKQNQALVAQYRVGPIPCFVMLVDGKEVDRVVGGTSPYRLEQMCKKGASAAPAGKPPAMLAQNSPPPPLPSSPFDERGNRPVAISPVSVPARAAGGVADTALIAASVRLRVADSDGRSCGSGTIIDVRSGEALILTCGHIFRDSQGNGPITVDLFGSSRPQQVPGRLISYDVNRDVGLVAIRTPGPVAMARVAPPGYSVDRGAPVVSVGCNNGEAPSARHSQVTFLNKFQGPPNIQVAGEPVEGRSGGGLFSREGYVIGVCNAADPSDKEGLFAALGSIYAELDRQNLSIVYSSPSGTPAGSPDAGAPSALARNTLPAIPKPTPGTVDLAALGSASAPMTGASTGLPPHERAALEEIGRRIKEGAEVVCIIRSREAPAAKSEVIMLDHASPEFVRLLSVDARPQNRPYPTSLELRSPRKKLLEWSAADDKAADGGWRAEGASDGRSISLPGR